MHTCLILFCKVVLGLYLPYIINTICRLIMLDSVSKIMFINIFHALSNNKNWPAALKVMSFNWFCLSQDKTWDCLELGKKNLHKGQLGLISVYNERRLARF